MNTPLVVDLDGTLIFTDLLVETANAHITSKPGAAFALLRWWRQGRDQLKLGLAQSTSIDVSALPFNEPLLNWLRTQKSAGRTLVLATASAAPLAQQVANFLAPLFDEVLATEPGVNLKSHAKAQRLVERFGSGHFDYVGNHQDDLPIWTHARQAHVVTHSRSLLDRVRGLTEIGQVFEPERPSRWRIWAKALRVHQWVKNLLVIVPLLTAHAYTQAGALSAIGLAFGAFSLTASAVYLLNDLVDVQDDRHHHRKRHRPFASGQLSLLTGWMAWPLLLGLAFALSSLLPSAFVAALLCYFLLTLAYSFVFKEMAIWDVLLLAMLYTMRIIAGSAAVDVALSFWLLLFSMFLFLSLALIKRFSELFLARQRGQTGALRGRGYQPDDLELVSSLGASSGLISILVLGLYIQDSRTAALYPAPQMLWLACPALLVWLMRAWLIAHRGAMHDDPILFALKDRTSWLILIFIVAAFTLGRYGG
ncbi:MAG: UbiA family prenyltransferase [Limnohabitans sp.]